MLIRGISRAYRGIWPLVPPLVDETLRMWRNLGYLPNVRSPGSFNEKIAYRKLFTKDQRYAQLADKWAVRDYVKQKIGSECLIRVYQHVADVADLDIGALPKRFVAKGRHDSGSVVLVDGHDKQSIGNLLVSAQKLLSRVHGIRTYEYWYRDIPAGLIVEERLLDDTYSPPLDYKFLVFHGRAEYVQVIERTTHGTMQRFYDRSWQPLAVQRRGSGLAPVMERPQTLEYMLEIAETLGEGFDFVRVDLFAPNDEAVFFGEITFAPAAGRKAFLPRDFDWELGKRW